MSTRRNTELALLLAAAVPVLILFALIGIQANASFSWTYLSVPASLFVLFALTHMSLRKLAPGADPVLLPIAFLLSGVGLAFVTRLAPDEASTQVLWLFVSIIAFIVVLVLAQSLEKIANYKYILMLIGLVLLIAPAIFGRTINGSKLWLRLPGGISFQPGEIARILIILFLAAYLAQNREMLSVSTRRIFGIPLPDPRTLAPLLLMWGVSLIVLIFERDLGSSLLFFGIFLTMLYAATGRISYVLIGLVLFAGGAVAAYFLFGHVQTRVDIWLHPFQYAQGSGYQLVQSLYSFAGGGLFGAGPGQGFATRIPAVDTDFIFAAIGEELGLVGAVALLLCYLTLVYRGLSTASRAKSDMAAFVAVGLVASLGLQVFVIVGGVSRLIPLTGITVPFISRGGSSMLSTFILLALLVRASDETTGVEAEMKSTGGALSVLGRISLARRLGALSALFSLLIAALVVNLSWVQVVQANALNNHAGNTRNLAKEARNPRGSILTSDNVILAESVPETDANSAKSTANPGRDITYKRTYPQGKFAAHLLGYYSTRYGRTGLESAENDTLTGNRNYATLSDVIDSALGRPVPGNNISLTLNSKVQKAAEDALGNRKGAIVALNPKTGAVLASVSYPDYDPNTITDNWSTLNSDTSAPLLDRSRQTLLAPGSTFKVVTLTGAYANKTVTDKDMFPAPAQMDIGNAPVTNFERSGYARMNIVTATQKSVNTVYGQVAVKLGANKLVKQASNYGFGKDIPFDLGITTSLMPDPSEMTTWETAWAGIGQPVGEHTSPAGPQATVYQMALVAAGIANKGVVMRPYVVDHITSAHNGKDVLGKTTPRTWLRATDANTAEHVTQDMMKVVKAGSGVRAQISGVDIAGKTGTAEVGDDLPTNAWFIGFAPAKNPKVALAVLVEGGGQGGQTAAPAAKPVFEAALAAAGGVE